MKIRKKTIRIGCLAVLLSMSLFSYRADAHSLWLNFTNYMPAVSASGQMKSTLYIGWGHHFPVDSFVKPDDFEKITLRAPSGAEKDITLETTGFSAAPIALEQPGLYTAAVTRRAVFNTSYMDKGKKVTVKGDKRGKAEIISSVYSQQFAKSVICAGGKCIGDIGHTFGQKLEIIPMTNPYEITNNRGGLMKVKVLFDGKPVPFLKIWGTYEGYSLGDAASAMVSTDREGVAAFRIDHWGIWLLRTRYDRSAMGELAEKVNDEHYFASFTFAVP